MRFLSAWALAIGIVTVLTVAACSNESTSPTSGGSPTTAPIATVMTGAGTSGSTAAMDPADFSTAIDNIHFPLHRGTSFIYEGSSEDGAKKVTVTVLFEIKVVMGVECRVVLDEVFVRDELRESTRDCTRRTPTGTSGTSGRTPRSTKVARWPAPPDPGKLASMARYRASS